MTAPPIPPGCVCLAPSKASCEPLVSLSLPPTTPPHLPPLFSSPASDGLSGAGCLRCSLCAGCSSSAQVSSPPPPTCCRQQPATSRMLQSAATAICLMCALMRRSRHTCGRDFRFMLTSAGRCRCGALHWGVRCEVPDVVRCSGCSAAAVASRCRTLGCCGCCFASCQPLPLLSPFQQSKSIPSPLVACFPQVFPMAGKFNRSASVGLQRSSAAG